MEKLQISLILLTNDGNINRIVVETVSAASLAFSNFIKGISAVLQAEN